jgi:succinate-semialdehyde dehydrogenase / glutarate-semialdehyde dehydrogenase
MMVLKNFINGQWIDFQADDYFEVVNPATLEVLGKIPWNYSSKIVRDAIDSAYYSFKNWSALTVYDRIVFIEKLKNAILEKKEEFARTITCESGKVIKEAETEVLYACDYISSYIAEAKAFRGETIPSHLVDKRILAIRQPLGVVACITPWNFPLAMVVRKIIPALLVGCTTVIKPAEQTPITAYKLFELINNLHFPKGVANLVFGNPKVIGEIFCESEKVAKISFTGSVEVGKILMKNSSNTLKKLTMELGGNAPFIVFEDAKIDDALEGLARCKFRNAGQTCISANRILLHRKIYDEFIERLAVLMKNLKVGNGLEPNTNIGPLINEEALQKVDRLVKDAISCGAKLLLGGENLRKQLGGYFYQPTLLVNVTKRCEFGTKRYSVLWL